MTDMITRADAILRIAELEAEAVLVDQLRQAEAKSALDNATGLWVQIIEKTARLNALEGQFRSVLFILDSEDMCTEKALGAFTLSNHDVHEIVDEVLVIFGPGDGHPIRDTFKTTTGV